VFVTKEAMADVGKSNLRSTQVCGPPVASLCDLKNPRVFVMLGIYSEELQRIEVE
jgi:hypothetical protein